ncbi:MAG: translation initiation factor IF-5A [Candidatus Aenigmarchaeota archaeon]|nr:translation initiation factor IF-5A [Candidatus Aenigmarchaeota archaeon]
MPEKRSAEIKNLKPGSYVLIDDVPCVVEKVQKSKAGKHGAAKARMMARGVFDTSIKKIIVKPAIIEKKNAQVISLTDDNAHLMDLVDYTTFEVKIPEELKGQLTEGDEVTTWEYGTYRMIKSKKSS